MNRTNYLACDLGAESGRLMLGTIADDRIVLEEVHRFSNTPIEVGTSLCWNIARLFDSLGAGLCQVARRGVSCASIATDSWGVDYVLLDAEGQVLSPTYHYRDSRTVRGVEAVRAAIAWPEVFAETGIQFMPLNTIYQLAAETPERLAQAHCLCGVGDAFNHLLAGGEPVIEESMASTFQLYNPLLRDWSGRLLEAVGLPRRLFPKVVPSGTRLGGLKPGIAAATGLGDIQVIASCSHDTGSAVAAVPARGTRPWAYLSSGTWSLLGVEEPRPLINDRCRDLNFTNEIGYGGSIRLLKNIVGLWLVQECRRHWAETGRDLNYDTLTRLAGEVAPFKSLINPMDPRFLAPGKMPTRIAAYCRETGQPEPASPAETVRCALESLALQYRRTLFELGELIGTRPTVLHIVGGGSRNTLLNQFTANATECLVEAGPVEATALGNVLIQAITLGHLPSLEAARGLVRQSSGLIEFEPADSARWREAAARFEALPGG